MSKPEIYHQTESDLSVAWSRAYLALADGPEHELSPFMVSIGSDKAGLPSEDAALRQLLDDTLKERKFPSIEKVAKSIFPQAMWQRAKGDRHKLFDSYRQYLPDFISMEPTKNSRGIYFARLIAFGINPKGGNAAPHIPAELLKHNGNQLEFIINTCKPGAQRMALQAAIYDPVRDQTPARHGFPCLQHLTFAPDFSQKTLSLNAFYATQQLFIKAYGNWLGLMRLGHFVAGETGLTFDRLNCFAGIQKMEIANRPQKGKLAQQLLERARLCVAEHDAKTTLRLRTVCSAS